MTKQFNVGDNIKYTSPYPPGQILIGVVKAVDTVRFSYGNNKETSYNVFWNDGTDGWISGRNLSLESTTGEISISDVKELKAELESEIFRLIQEFNKKTNLKVNDVDLNCYRAVSGGCFYQVSVKVEI